MYADIRPEDRAQGKEDSATGTVYAWRVLVSSSMFVGA